MMANARKQAHQLLPALGRGDAIGNEAFEIRRLLRAWGYESDIYVGHMPSKPGPGVRSYRDYARVSRPENILIYHHAIGSPLARYIQTLPDRKVLIYHNLTPYEYYMGINDGVAYLLKTGREELETLVNVTTLALADSEYNRQELEAIGYKNTFVLPPIVEFDHFKKKPDASVAAKMRDGKTNILFVGRITPNKSHDDLIKTFYCYKKYFNPESRLILVGGYKGTERYFDYLKDLIAELKIEDVIMTGPVSLEALLAYYQSADIFLCLSEHEGFCVPLLEAMHFDLPIVAYKATAIPWTLGEAGLMVDNKSYMEISGLLQVLARDKSLRDELISAGKRRLEFFATDKIVGMFHDYIKALER